MASSTSPSGPTNPIRRKRPFLPKVKTGCSTCKIRKVKCDEGRPECRRCSSTGRKCDGYETPRSSSSTSNTPSPGRDSSLMPTHPDLAGHKSLAERRSFDYFQSHASQALAGYFHLPFWSRDVLQAALYYPSIRHLVIAIGAAYESFEVEGPDRPGRSHSAASNQLALQQSNQSIRHMGELFQSAASRLATRRGAGPGSTETTCCILTASILFAYLASLQGQMSQAMEHIRSGLRVLQDFDTTHQDTSRLSPSSGPVPISRLRKLLTALYSQVRCMINDEARTQLWHRDLLVSDLEPVTEFASVTDAHAYVEALFQNMLAFLQATDFRPPRTAEELLAFHDHRAHLSHCHKSSVIALEALRSPNGAENGTTILRVYHILIEIRLTIDPLRPELRESTFDALQPQLKQILEYCETLVSSSSSTAFKDDPRLGFARCYSGLGIVMPLHTVAARSRISLVRRRALELLLGPGGQRRRECLWDGLLTGKIAAKTVEIEEQGALAERGTIDEIPPDKRVREVKIEFGTERTVVARYITVGEWKRGGHGIRHVIEW